MLPEGVLKVLDVNSTLILQAKKKKMSVAMYFWYGMTSLGLPLYSE